MTSALRPKRGEGLGCSREDSQGPPRSDRCGAIHRGLLLEGTENPALQVTHKDYYSFQNQEGCGSLQACVPAWSLFS